MCVLLSDHKMYFCRYVTVHSYIIFVLFSPQKHFLDKFFSTQKCVNRDKKFSTKQCKSPKSWFYNSLMQQNTINCTRHFSTLQIFFTFLKWRAFSIWKFITWRISPHDNLLREEISPHDKKISTGTACGACDKYQVCILVIANKK